MVTLMVTLMVATMTSHHGRDSAAAVLWEIIGGRNAVGVSQIGPARHGRAACQ